MIEETLETGPLRRSIWDTRTRENCAWCPYCSKWLSKWGLAWVKPDDLLAYHQREYCKPAPTYRGSE